MGTSVDSTSGGMSQGGTGSSGSTTTPGASSGDTTSGPGSSSGGPAGGCDGLGPAGLLYHSTLDDVAAVATPAVGLPGVVNTTPADSLA